MRERFAVIGQSRTGTTMLGSALGTHPAVLMHGEIFGHPYYPLNFYGVDPGLPWPTPLELYLKRVRDTDTARFLDEAVFAPTGRVATGFKFKFEEFSLWPQVVDYLWTRRTKILLVYRRNLWHRYLSEIEAGLSGFFNTSDRTSTAPADPAALGLKITPEGVLDAFRESEEYIRLFDEKFKENPILRVAYEDLVGSYTEEFLKVVDFIGVLHREVQPFSSRRTGARRIDELVDFPAIEAFFRGSRYEAFFAESA